MPTTKPISKEMIVNGLQYAKSVRSLARYLGCSYVHLRKYMKLYTDDEGVTFQEKYRNQKGIGIRRMQPGSTKATEEKINKILAGGSGWESVDPSKFVQEVVRMGYYPECCNKCGFRERRMIDYKVPLLLNFQDGNKNNFKQDNIELVCYNCFFLYIGEVFNHNQKRSLQSKQETVKQPTLELDDEYWEKVKFEIQKENEKLQSYGSEFISRL